jgi:hypothetical protein
MPKSKLDPMLQLLDAAIAGQREDPSTQHIIGGTGLENSEIEFVAFVQRFFKATGFKNNLNASKWLNSLNLVSLETLLDWSTQAGQENIMEHCFMETGVQLVNSEQGLFNPDELELVHTVKFKGQIRIDRYERKAEQYFDREIEEMIDMLDLYSNACWLTYLSRVGLVEQQSKELELYKANGKEDFFKFKSLIPKAELFKKYPFAERLYLRSRL